MTAIFFKQYGREGVDRMWYNKYRELRFIQNNPFNREEQKDGFLYKGKDSGYSV